MKPVVDVRTLRGAVLVRCSATLAVVGLLSFAAACRSVSLTAPVTEPAAAGDAAREPEGVASEVVASSPAGPWLSVSAPRATFREAGSGLGGELAAGETRELADGAAVNLLDCGRARLHWSDEPNVAVGTVGDAEAGVAASTAAGATTGAEAGVGQAADALVGEMVRGAEVVVDSVDLEARLIALTQEAGTVRYVLADVEYPVAITVAVGAAVVSPRGPADIIVSWAPYPTLATAPATDEPVVPPADVAGPEIVWVVVVEGEAEIEMAVDVDGQAAPSLDAAGDTGPTVAGAGETVALDATGQVVGWEVLSVADVEVWFADVAACVGTGSIVDLNAAESATATAAAAVAATATAAARAAGGRTQASLIADRDVLVAGECTVIRWQATNALIVSLDGSDVNHAGSREVCPDETTTYTLGWVRLTGSSDETTVTITVNPAPGQEERRQDAERKPTDAPTAAGPTATCIPCDRPSTAAPGTASPPPTLAPLPTLESEPTAAPPTIAPPTAAPTPIPNPTEPQPTAPPEP